MLDEDLEEVLRRLEILEEVVIRRYSEIPGEVVTKFCVLRNEIHDLRDRTIG
jgi:hypothetical protein